MESMTRADVVSLFQGPIYTFMFGDIRREIGLAFANIGGGNLLAALGLLCYTEFMGSILTGWRGVGCSRRNFEAFFDYMGDAYSQLRKNGVDVYDVFRCGAVHEFAIKGEATMIAMLEWDPSPGIVRDAQGRFTFHVESYFRDFAAACRRLE